MTRSELLAEVRAALRIVDVGEVGAEIGAWRCDASLRSRMRSIRGRLERIEAALETEAPDFFDDLEAGLYRFIPAAELEDR